MIIAQAGRPGAVTIATNMAGRGTDIVLGGNLEAEIKSLGESVSQDDIDQTRKEWAQRHQEVIDAGGLHIIGAERHESRRIDNQLRGRSGRQGDPGSSRFYLSLDDDLLRIFGDPQKTQTMLSRVGMEQEEAIESSLLTKQIERAQTKVESHNFDIRKNLLEYDDVANDQRSVIYQLRKDILDAESIGEMIDGISEEVMQDLVGQYIEPESMEETWDVDGLQQALLNDYMIDLDLESIIEKDETINEGNLWNVIHQEFQKNYSIKENAIGQRPMREIEKAIMIQQLDMQWREHLASMDHLRQGIHLRGYAQKNPKQEYKRESFDYFDEMLSNQNERVLKTLFGIELISENKKENNNQQQNKRIIAKKIGRNDACPCGSGKKYKMCHGA